MLSRRIFIFFAILASSVCSVFAQETNESPTNPPMPENTLVVYYSYGGQTEKVAKILSGLLSASTYKIETVRPYDPTDAKTDRQRGYLPEIKRNFPQLKNFDRVVLVFPVWGYTVSLPMQKFLSIVDLKDKHVDAVAVGVGKLGGTFNRLDEMLKGVALEKTNSITYPEKRTDESIKALLSKWNTGTVPKIVSLGKGIQAGVVPLTEVTVENPTFALRIPRTVKYSHSTAPSSEPLKPTEPAPGVMTIQPNGSVWVDGVEIGKTTSQLPKGTFKEGEMVTFY